MLKNKKTVVYEPEWTVMSLKEYMCTVFQEYADKVEQRFEAMDRAVCKSEVATEKRFESVNEFRGQLSDQNRTFIPRLEYELAHKGIEDKIEALRVNVSRIENIKEGANITWLYIVAIISIVMSVSALLIDLITK